MIQLKVGIYLAITVKEFNTMLNDIYKTENLSIVTSSCKTSHQWPQVYVHDQWIGKFRQTWHGNRWRMTTCKRFYRNYRVIWDGQKNAQSTNEIDNIPQKATSIEHSCFGVLYTMCLWLETYVKSICTSCASHGTLHIVIGNHILRHKALSLTRKIKSVSQSPSLCRTRCWFQIDHRS